MVLGLSRSVARCLPDAFSTEYALTWEQAIAGTGGHVFTDMRLFHELNEPPGVPCGCPALDFPG